MTDLLLTSVFEDHCNDGGRIGAGSIRLPFMAVWQSLRGRNDDRLGRSIVFWV